MFMNLYQPNYMQIYKIICKTIDKIKLKEYSSINTKLQSYK